MAPLDAPIMEMLDCTFHAFFVPERILWKDFEEFITTGANGNEQPVRPYLNWGPTTVGSSGPLAPSSLHDYLGFPTVQNTTIPSSGLQFDAAPFLAYQMIYQDYFRDDNLIQPAFEFPVSSGPLATVGSFNLRDQAASIRYRAWSKDYFTSALTSPQLGGDVSVPLVGEAPVQLKSNGVNLGVWSDQNGNTTSGAGDLQVASTGQTIKSVSGGAAQNVNYNPNGTLIANLSGVSSVTINNLRLAVATQQWKERMITGGSRYKEQLYSMFGVISPDARLQRPEYLGKLRMNLQIGEVFQTSQTTAESPQGEMTGRSNTYCSGFMFKKYNFKEHGWLLILMSIKPRATYQQGLSRKLSKKNWYDFAWPILSNLGEQPVLNKEIYYNPTLPDTESSSNNAVFGYQSRYSEYKFIHSSVHGDFRTSLNFWHLGRIFTSQPGLNRDFIEVRPHDFNRIFAVTSQPGTAPYSDRFWYQILFDIRCNRPIPRFARPGGFTI